MKIKNKPSILSHGDIESRKIVLDITESVLEQLDSYNRIKQLMSLEGDILRVGTREWDLSRKKHVYLVGAGKACNHMAMAVDEVLGSRLTKGIAIVKIKEDTDVFRRTEVYVGGHPLPNRDGYEASKKIIGLVDQAGPDDLFIAVISGGSSALMCCPVDGISLEDEILTTDVLLKSGASIREINAVRRHISALNGGMLAKRIAEKGAELIGFGISDAVGNPPSEDIRQPFAGYNGTPIGPDKTTLGDARNVIRNYNVFDRLPRAVTDHIFHSGPEAETPKSFPQNTYFRINTLPDASICAKKAAEALGIPAYILSTFLEGEAAEVGTVLASIAREIKEYGNPFPAPCVLIIGGEATTRIPDNSVIKGHGGPGQEETLSFALSAAAIPGACLLSIDSEGTDGTTTVAGGITDSTTYRTCTERGADIYEALRTHSAYEALKKAGDTVFTGNTGTNLCDINILYIPE